MVNDTLTIAEFVKEQRISMTAVRVDRNPNMDDSSNMDHWKCVLVRKNEPLDPDMTICRTCGWEWYPDHRCYGEPRKAKYTMTLTFSQGYGHNGREPEVESVLSCLASDAATIENCRGFEDFCSELGYDSYSRKAERTFKACEHQTKRLKAFLTPAQFDALVWHTESL